MFNRWRFLKSFLMMKVEIKIQLRPNIDEMTLYINDTIYNIKEVKIKFYNLDNKFNFV